MLVTDTAALAAATVCLGPTTATCATATTATVITAMAGLGPTATPASLGPTATACGPSYGYGGYRPCTAFAVKRRGSLKSFHIADNVRLDAGPWFSASRRCDDRSRQVD